MGYGGEVMAKRVQMTRNKPWRAENPDAVKVDRSTQFGNPFAQIVPDGWKRSLLCYVPKQQPVLSMGVFEVSSSDPAIRRENAATIFKLWAWGPAPDAIALRAAARAELAGRDLACWCPLDGPCHADTLLELANSHSDDEPTHK